MLVKTWKSRNLLFLVTKEMKTNFCPRDLVFSNFHAYDKPTPKRPVIENKVYNDRTPKLNMARVGTYACNCT